MQIELFTIFQIATLVFFVISFYSKHELMWGLTILMGSIITFSSLDVQYYFYAFNATSASYTLSSTTSTYYYIMWLNIVVVAFAMLFLGFDLYEKYIEPVAESSDKGAREKDNLVKVR